MTKLKTVPFTEEDVKAYLDRCIEYWRKSKEVFAVYYIDAFQSVRMSLFDETLPGEENAKLGSNS